MMRAALLLIVSNVFMTFAWYGHLRHTSRALWIVVLVSWGIAFFEYCFQVPANRIGFVSGMSGAQLKTLQEVITLVVFAVFSVAYLKESLRWNVVVGFVLIAAGAAFVYGPWQTPAATAGRTTGAWPSIERGASPLETPGSDPSRPAGEAP